MGCKNQYGITQWTMQTHATASGNLKRRKLRTPDTIPQIFLESSSLEAIASRLEAIATRVEDIASRLEAIYIISVP